MIYLNFIINIIPHHTTTCGKTISNIFKTVEFHCLWVYIRYLQIYTQATNGNFIQFMDYFLWYRNPVYLKIKKQFLLFWKLLFVKSQFWMWYGLKFCFLLYINNKSYLLNSYFVWMKNELSEFFIIRFGIYGKTVVRNI